MPPGTPSRARTSPWLALLVAAALLSLVGRAAAQGTPGSHGPGGEGERRHLVILHTNDLHGQVEPRPAVWLRMPNPPMAGGLRRVGGHVQRVRRELRGSGSDLLVVDAGDWFQGTPEGALDDGEAFLGAVATVGYDALCVGNHEFDHGVDVLARLLAAVELPAVLANVSCPDPGLGLPAYRIIERAGLRIAVVGLLTPDTPAITHPSARACTFRDPARELAEVRRALEGKADWILPLTHLGVDGDRELARAHPDLDLIVGGHSHTLLKEGVLEGSTRIVQAGSKASAVGRVDVWFDAHGEVVELEAQIVDLYREPEARDADEALDRALTEMQERTAEVMGVEVGRLLAPMVRAERPLTSSSAGNLITDALRAHTGADVAVHNRGGIRANLYGGVVTRRDLFDVLPFANHVVVLTLDGRQLEECLRQAIEGEGRRGPEVSGMQLELTRAAEGRVSLARVLVAGTPLEPEREYTVATNSFLAARGDGYDIFAEARERRDDPVLLRELLEAVFEREGEVRPPEDDRYRVR